MAPSVSLQPCTLWRAREAKRKAARDSDKHTIVDLRRTVNELQWQLQAWESWWCAACTLDMDADECKSAAVDDVLNCLVTSSTTEHGDSSSSFKGYVEDVAGEQIRVEAAVRIQHFVRSRRESIAAVRSSIRLACSCAVKSAVEEVRKTLSLGVAHRPDAAEKIEAVLECLIVDDFGIDESKLDAMISHLSSRYAVSKMKPNSPILQKTITIACGSRVNSLHRVVQCFLQRAFADDSDLAVVLLGSLGKSSQVMVDKISSGDGDVCLGTQTIHPTTHETVGGVVEEKKLVLEESGGGLACHF